LLGLAALVCLVLGIFHLLATYGQKIGPLEAAVGSPVTINATYVRPFGPPMCVVFVEVHLPSGARLMEKVARRSWLCFYAVEFQVPPINEPFQLEVQMGEFTGPGGSRGQKLAKSQTIDVH
jgi:hypothetical protein